MEKRKIRLDLVDIYKPYNSCGVWHIETTLSDEELQEFLDNHKNEFPGEYSTDTFDTAIEEHKDIEVIGSDFDDLELDF